MARSTGTSPDYLFNLTCTTCADAFGFGSFGLFAAHIPDHDLADNDSDGGACNEWPIIAKHFEIELWEEGKEERYQDK